MATKQKKTEGGRALRASTAGPTSAIIAVGDCERLLGALDRFVTENSGFESSIAGDLVHDGLSAAADINSAAMVPLSHKVFGFETSLRWGFFLHHAPARIVSEDADTIPPAFQDAQAWPPFDPGQYFTEIVKVFDLAAEQYVWDLCETAEEPSDEDAGTDDV